ncbi:MAG: peptidylprolyl isomerase [Alphaproteobacteria bacterium]|jgi:peptidyl-prolyl cis-trans isomerase C|nr:peptidylprolyl isomerase [Alphaproteobacteria bacterium]
MKPLSTFVATTVLSLSLAVPAQLMAQDRIAVATIDGDSIWLDEIMAVAETLPPEYQQQGIASIYDQLVDDVANSRLAAIAARSSGLDKEEDVASAMKTAADRVLAEAYITREVGKEITEEAIQTAYDAYVADTGSRETVTASHILVETEEAARAIIDQLKDGADFAELAREKSTGPSGPNGGSLGSFGRGQMVPAFEAAAFGMPVGGFSDNPVQTQFGWHVIQVSDKGIEQAPELDQMRDQIAANLSRQSFARIVETLRAGTTIEVRPLTDVMTEAQQAAENAQ